VISLVFSLTLITLLQMIDDLSINTILDKVLEDVGCIDSRASKMDVDDLLKYALCASYYDLRSSLS
jgi:hypothetical protein